MCLFDLSFAGINKGVFQSTEKLIFHAGGRFSADGVAVAKALAQEGTFPKLKELEMLVKLDKGPAIEHIKSKHYLRPFLLDVYRVDFNFGD